MQEIIINADAYARGLARGGQHARILQRATLRTNENGTAVLDGDALSWRALKSKSKQLKYVASRPEDRPLLVDYVDKK